MQATAAPPRFSAQAGGFALALLALAAAGCRGGPGAGHEGFVRHMNQGTAYLENRDSAGARESFTAALELEPDSAAALRNLARAELLAQEADAALATLERAAEAGGESAATSYLTGLALARLGRFGEAVPHFETAVALDPKTAALRFQLAVAYRQADRPRDARTQFEETLRLDPWHTAAAYRLANDAAVLPERRARQRWSREFQRLRGILGEENRSDQELERCVHTRGERPAAPPGTAPPPPPVRFTDATAGALAAWEGAPIAALTLLEVAPDGRYTFFAADTAGGAALLVWSAAAGGFEVAPLGLDLSALGTPRHAAAGNFHDAVPEGVRYDPQRHALADVAVAGEGGLALFEQTAAGELRDVTAAAGLAGVTGRRLRWLDAEHDGDLDLAVMGAGGLALWLNRGDGTFAPAGEDLGAALAGPVTDLAAADLDADVALDLVAARGEAPTAVLTGQREGRFAPLPEPPGPWPAAGRVVVGDLDGDAEPDAALLAPSRVAVVASGGGREEIDLGAAGARALTLFDPDNDGRLDLAVAGEEGVRLFRNPGQGGGWTETTGAAGLDTLELPPAAELLAADADGDGDTDLLHLAAGGGLRVLANQGGDVLEQLKVRLVGTKTNPGGLGTRVEAIAGTFRAARWVGELPVEIGLGEHRRLDAVRMVWTNGVVDNELDVEAGSEPLTLVEKNVATGSCPFLYAWDGERFAFVTDLLGNAPIGLPLERGRPLPADPDELVRIGGPEVLAVEDGAYRLAVTSEFREVLYLDQTRLVAADHPPGVEVHPTDKVMPPPFPPSELRPLGRRRPLRGANDGSGADRSAELAEVDGRFVLAGTPLPPPFRGMTAPASLVLDFGPLDPARPWVLALTGWLQWGDASTNIALSQGAGAEVVPPRLEAETAGGWRPLAVIVGMPAGKTKTILVDLAGALPPGARRLRLTGSFEIRWDRLALFERLPGSVLQTHGLAPGAAEISWHGFSELRARAPEHPTTPLWERAAPHPPWETALAGWSTRYGDVLELVGERDGRLVVVNSGDAVALAFPAAELPPPPAGWRRTFFFYSVGWDKDGDHNVEGGDRVGPLPREAAVAAGTDDDWELTYNTRWVPRRPYGR